MRLNWLAIAVSAIVLFLFGWLWYTVFGDAWAASLGTTREAMMAANGSNPYPYIISIVMAFFLAYGVARVLAWRNPTAVWRGAFDAFSMGLLFFGTMLWTTYAYEHRTPLLGLINVGYVSIGMAIQGAILTAWKRRA